MKVGCRTPVSDLERERDESSLKADLNDVIWGLQLQCPCSEW